MEWNPPNECLYVVLNQILRSPNREQRLRPWYLYLKLFLNALFRLPALNTIVFRGVKLHMNENYIRGEIVHWWGFSSCTISLDVLNSDQFLGRTGDRTSV
ncbi:unnamed protein product [Adineta ricciae]|nr:unnamed protein product [Adineta ricciae]